MFNAADGRNSGAEESASASTPPASSAASSPALAPSEPSSAGQAAAMPVEQGGSELLKKIQELQETQRALKEQKKKCQLEIRNATKRKKRIQDRASQLSDTDLVEVLRMRKARKDVIASAASSSQVHGAETRSNKGSETENP